MKQKSKEIKLTITQPTKLYFEDLEQIYSLLLSVMDRVSIENDDYEIESLKELLEYKTTSLNNLSFKCYKDLFPGILFYLRSESIYIILMKDEPLWIGIIEKVKEIIKNRKRSVLFSRPAVYTIASLSIALGIIYLIITLLGYYSSDLLIVMASLSLILGFANIYLAKSSKNLIELTYSKNSLSFWQKNSDKILIDLAIGLFLLILGYLIYKFTGVRP